MNLPSCSSRCSFSSGVLASTKSQLKTSKSFLCISQLGRTQWSGRLHDRSKASNVTACYGLRSPPYKLDALEPYMSQKTLEVHWGAHHRNYVEALNKQLEKNDVFYGCNMDELVKVTYNNGNPLPEFNNAAQHAYYLDY